MMPATRSYCQRPDPSAAHASGGRRALARIIHSTPPGRAWPNAQAAFFSQVVGPHFESLCREWALDAGDSTFGDWPGMVAAGVVPDPANRTQIQVDVAVLGPEIPGEPQRVLSLGEAKWGKVMTPRPYQAAPPRARPARGEGIRHQCKQADLL